MGINTGSPMGGSDFVHLYKVDRVIAKLTIVAKVSQHCQQPTIVLLSLLAYLPLSNKFLETCGCTFFFDMFYYESHNVTEIYKVEYDDRLNIHTNN